MRCISIKKLSLALFLLGLTLPAFADDGIGISNKKGGFTVGIEALYLRSNTDYLDYAILSSSSGINTGVNSSATDETINTTYDWGGRIQIGYWFACSCYDINFAYTHLKTIDTDSVVAPVDQLPDSVIVIPPLSDAPVSASLSFPAADSKAEFNLNVTDLDAGRHVSGNNYDIRLFAGLRYATINRDLYTSGEPTPDSSEIAASQEFKSHFKGVGPRIGAQGRYGQCCGFGLDADINIAVLVGYLDSNYQSNQLYPADEQNDQHTVHHTARQNKNRAIPALEAKLGLDYTYRLPCKRDATLVLEAGYQASTYFDVINTPSLNNQYDGEYTSMTSETSNAAFSGLYLGVKYCA